MRQTLALAATLLLVVTATSCAPAGGGPNGRSGNHSAPRDVAVQTGTATGTASSSQGQSDTPARRAARAAAARLDFGHIPLGTPIHSLPRGATWQQGCGARAIAGCGFNLDGVSYGTDWEDNIVVIKTITVGDQRPTGLPFGLRGDETIDTALALLNAQFGGAFEIGSNDTGARFVIAHSANARLDYFEVSLSFQRSGRLSEVRASCCYN